MPHRDEWSYSRVTKNILSMASMISAHALNWRESGKFSVVQLPRVE
jgi:hypothetical protein